MSDHQGSSQIKVFISAIVMLVVMWMATGVLTYIIPSGTFDGTWVPSDQAGISFLKWLGAPILVLFSDSGALVIAIILFLLIIGGSIYLLQETGLVEGVILKIAKRFENNAFQLMGILILFFMALGAFVGVFEEVVPLAPLVLILSRKMGWDDLTGMGITVLACGVGFAAAVTNPFTIGVAQQLADLPVFSGAPLRALVFITVYIVLFAYLYRHAQKHSTVTGLKAKMTETEDLFDKVDSEVVSASPTTPPKRAYTFFVLVMSVMLVYVLISPFVAWMRDLSLIVIALSFLIAALGVGMMTYGAKGGVIKRFLKGAVDMSPAIILILLATSIKYVMMEGQILDSILYYVSTAMMGLHPITAIVGAFFLVMLLNFFIGSGSAKAFILMPILMPMMDMLGMGRQLGILAFQFGDGFSNILYPTNAVLLISLGLTQISYGRWLKFILPLQVMLLILSIAWLAAGYVIGYGLT
ncbi:YfcC family protein [Fusibacter paucivorans]|uniref:YfcC family protein n=1 Tax=Fusibacter paucivorans TaxID=76009 RepID=A0ABS5PRN2_9FIRM|nr:AbgT family transporter [Fusibacter paucivorans]MBS7527818.1 YfcC family protein [Fusibacter paucivorans]